MNFEQISPVSDKLPSKSLENKNSLDLYYGIISKKALDIIKFSEDKTWKGDPAILKKVEEKINDPDFQIKVKNIWNDSTIFIDFEEQEEQLSRGLVQKLKDEIFRQ